MSESRHDFYWLIAGAVALAIMGSSMLAMHQVANWFDDISKRREQVVVANGIAARANEVAKLVVPNAIWDDAIRNLDNTFNAGWAHDNVGVYLSNLAGFQAAGVLDSNNVPIYAMEKSTDVDPAKFSAYVRAAESLVAKVRESEAARQSPQSLRFAGSNLREPIQATAARAIDDKIFLITATLVQPDMGNAQILKPRAPIILTGLEVGQSFADTFAQRYLLENAHFEIGDARDQMDEAHAGLADERGTYLATLDWSPRKPGTEIFGHIEPWLLLGIAASIAIFFVQYRRVQRAKKSLMLSERNATHIAAHDALTGLCNRADFECRLMAVSSDPSRVTEAVTVFCVDVDHFTEINDRFGHAVGDELLQGTARRLADICGHYAICARFGGDGFAALIPNLDLAGANQLAAALVEAFAVPFSLQVGEKRVSCSVGVAVANPLATGALEILRRADLALHQAKLDGRNCYRCYDEKLDANFQLRGQLAEFLERDIAAGRLSIAYQPQVTATGELFGVEALVRWSTSEHGAISPSIFVPLAEQAGLISKLGDFVIDKVLEDRQQWPNIKVAINLSASQFRDCDFAHRTLEKLAKSGTGCSNIEFELTEGVLMAQDGHAAEMLTELRKAGITIALDDFGTGYSSLSYLRRLPIDKIKIDKSFVSELGHADADALVKAIIDLAHALNLLVLAEGVETLEQKNALETAGCLQMQGYLTGRPMSAAAIEKLASGSFQPISPKNPMNEVTAHPSDFVQTSSVQVA